MPIVFAVSHAILIKRITNFKEKKGKNVLQSLTKDLNKELYNCHPNGMTQSSSHFQSNPVNTGGTTTTAQFFISQENQVTQFQKQTT